MERLALEAGSADAKDEYGKPAVVGAAEKGHTEVVEALLRLGSDPNAPDPLGRTALMQAAMEGQGGVVAALLEHGRADLDAVNKNGATALMHAAKGGHAAIAAQLVEARADTTVRATGGPYPGKSALEIAQAQGHSEVAALLQEPLVPELKPEPEGAQLRSQQSIERLVNNALDPLDGDQSPR
eukprot:COSAG04_NODE_3128_length_3138_cov_1.575189_2_plen_183_part_00